MTLSACKTCKGDGFVSDYVDCGCREAHCPHSMRFIVDPEEKSEGIYQKFWVRRTDGSSQKKEKHHKCDYFVLDWKHDKFAPIAARAYANACEAEYPDLANDLRIRADQAEGRNLAYSLSKEPK